MVSNIKIDDFLRRPNDYEDSMKPEGAPDNGDDSLSFSDPNGNGILAEDDPEDQKILEDIRNQQLAAQRPTGDPNSSAQDYFDHYSAGIPDKGVNDSPIITIEDDAVMSFIDSMSSCREERKYFPIEYSRREYDEKINNNGEVIGCANKEVIPHRSCYGKYHLRIGDSVFFIPPEFINIQESSSTVKEASIRARSTMKKKTGYSTTDMVIKLVFNGEDQINGYKIESPFGECSPYYIDGLRSFLAQCKVTPIMPVDNEFLNKTCGIYSIVIQNIQVNTVEGFPKLLECTLMATEFDSSVYTMAPIWEFTNFIEWDLYRYNYQRLLSERVFTETKAEKHILETDKLKKIRNLSCNNVFDIYMPDDSEFEDFESNEIENRITDVKDFKYQKILSSFFDEFTVTQLSFGFENIIVTPKLSNSSKPIAQYLGGGDSAVSIQAITKKNSTVSKFKDLIAKTQYIIKKLKDCSGIGFVKIDNPFIGLVGGSYLLIDSVTVETVPEHPGLYIINIQASSHDILSTKTEDLNGFRPFGDGVNGLERDTIPQNPIGLLNKISQEACVEYKMANIDLYPDLLLPSYTELDAAIIKINEFRKAKSLAPLPFETYPRPIAKTMLYDSPHVCNGTVDPDFYFMYPALDTSLITVLPSDLVTTTKVEAVNVNNVYKNTAPPGTEDNGANGEGVSGATAPTSCYELGVKTDDIVTKNFLDHLLSKVGCGYVFGAYGQVYYKRSNPKWTAANERELTRNLGGNPLLSKWLNKQCFDCSGFVGHGMWAVNYFSTPPRLNSEVFKTYCTVVDKHELKAGDIVIHPGHIAVYLGGGKVVEAQNSESGIVIAGLGNRFNWYGRLKWKETQYPYFEMGPIPSNKESSRTVNEDRERETSLPRTLRMPNNPMTPPSQDDDVTTDSDDVSGPSLDNETAPDFIGPIQDDKYKIGKFGGDYDRFDKIIIAKCKSHGVNPNWIKALMKQESNMDPKAISSVGAVGLLQVMEPICTDYGITFNRQKFYDPDINIDVGTRYIKQLYGMFGTYLDAVAAFNCGQGRWQQVLDGTKTMPTQTKHHREAIQKNYDKLIASGGSAATNLDGSGEMNSTGAGGVYDPFHKLINSYVTKQHGNRVIKNDGHFGIPIAVNSPYNKLLLEHISKKGILGSDNEDLFSTEGNIKVEVRKYIEKIKKEFVKDSFNNVYAKGFYEKCAYNQKVLRDITGSFDIDVESAGDNPIGDYHKLVSSTSDSKNNFGLISSTVDSGTYGCRGTMLKAFPTFSFTISTDSTDWFDGRKLWNNMYPYKAIMGISIAHDHEQPVGVAHITATNMSQNLSRYPKLAMYKTIADDDEYSAVNRSLYDNFGFIVGSPKITATMLECHNNILDEMKLQAGARIHIRLGYGNSFTSLPVVFNGHIAEVSSNDYVEIVAQSDGAELINNIISSDTDKTNGIMQLQQEPSNIISSLLIDRSSWTHMFNKKWGESSRYGVEHFGLYMGNNEGGIANQREYEYDLCKNIYLGTYKQELYCSKTVADVFDGETGVEMFLFNRTAWDTMNLAAQVLPEFIAYPRYHGFDTRIFYGIPTWLYKYRYDITGDLVIKEYCKAFSQLHLVNSNEIIDNRIKASSKFLHTNAIATYVLGNSSTNDVQTTPTMFADKSIDWSKQKTKVIDTALQQNYWGPDGLYEFLSFNEGITNAECVATTGLIESFSKSYYDEIIILGNPCINPYDEIFIDDVYGEMYGMARVNKVNHSFNANTGFTTSITPGMIAYSKSEDSGSTNIYRTKVNLMDLASSILGGRFKSVEFANEYAKAMYLTSYKTTGDFREEVLKSVMNLAPVLTTNAFVETLKTKADFVHMSYRSEYITRVIGNDLLKGLTSNSGPREFMKYLARIPLVRGVAGYFVHDNCIGIRPLLHKGRPFASGIKGAKYIMDGYGEMPDYQDVEV